MCHPCDCATLPCLQKQRWRQGANRKEGIRKCKRCRLTIRTWISHVRDFFYSSQMLLFVTFTAALQNMFWTKWQYLVNKISCQIDPYCIHKYAVMVALHRSIQGYSDLACWEPLFQSMGAFTLSDYLSIMWTQRLQQDLELTTLDALDFYLVNTDAKIEKLQQFLQHLQHFGLEIRAKKTNHWSECIL